MTEDTTAEGTKVLNLDQEFWAISERSNAGIPAVELDITTGKYVVLIFSSRDLAKKYCYVRNPNVVDNLYSLTRRTKTLPSGKKEVEQVGLIKVARNILLGKLDHITHFVLDHPGTRGVATYISVEDIAMLGRTPVSKNAGISELKDAINALDD